MTTAAPQVPELLRALWEQRKGAIIERLERVERALLTPSGADLVSAQSDAHKLRGVLGTFGFQEGSIIAGQAEDLLIADDSARQGWDEVARQCTSLRLLLVGGEELQHTNSAAEESK